MPLSTRERMSPMTAETARLALETLMGILERVHGVEIEMTIRGKRDDEKEN